jgi:hypothetical protein
MLELLSFHRSSLTDCLAPQKPKDLIPDSPEELVNLSNKFLIENERRRNHDLSRKIHPRDASTKLSLSYLDWSGFSGAAHSSQILQERKQESEREKARRQRKVPDSSFHRRSSFKRTNSFTALEPPPTLTRSLSARDLFVSKKALLDDEATQACMASQDYKIPSKDKEPGPSNESHKYKNRRHEARFNPLGGSLHSCRSTRTARSGRPALISSLSTSSLLGTANKRQRGPVQSNTTIEANVSFHSVPLHSGRPALRKNPSSSSLLSRSQHSRLSSSSTLDGGSRHPRIPVLL